MIALRFLWAILTWIVYELLSESLALLGLVLVPLAIACGSWQASPVTPIRQIFTAPRCLWLYGNDEEGYLPDWYAKAHPAWPRWRLMFIWAAIRNPVNNLRFIRWLHPPPDPARIRSVVRTHWHLCWQGPLYHFQAGARGWYFAIGWRYLPEDAKGVSAADWRRLGCGFQLSGGKG